MGIRDAGGAGVIAPDNQNLTVAATELSRLIGWFGLPLPIGRLAGFALGHRLRVARPSLTSPNIANLVDNPSHQQWGEQRQDDDHRHGVEWHFEFHEAPFVLSEGAL